MSRFPMHLSRALLLAVAVLVSGPSHAQAEASAVKAQAEAQLLLKAFDGTWRGQARVLTPEGKWLDLTQTERVGTLLGGSIRLVEGRGYAADGELKFNAFGVFSFDPKSGAYRFRTYAQGREGDFASTVSKNRFAWEIKAGPATIRYVATVEGDEWTEVGDRLVEGQPAMKIFEMKLRRLGPTNWPHEGFVTPQ